MMNSVCKQSTRAKGDEYEMFVLSRIEQIFEHWLPVNKEYYSVMHKKKYRGSAGNDIEVDIAVEFYREKNQKPSFIIIIECKDYASSIKTVVINDLIAKKNMIRAHKAVLITTSVFEQGVIQQADDQNIALVHLNYGDSEEQWILNRSIKTNKELYQEIVSSNLLPLGFVGIHEERAYQSFDKFFITAIIGDNTNSVPYIEESEMEREMMSLIGGNGIVYSPKLENTELYKLLDIFHFTIGRLENDDKRLGVCDFANQNILYSPFVQLYSKRWRFTIAHEIGHVVLHRKYFDVSKVFEEDEAILNTTTIDRMEVQANLFAAMLLMPKPIFIGVYLQFYDQLEIPKKNYPKIYVDNQDVNMEDFNNLIELLSNKFFVSKEAVEYRMAHFGLIEDHRKDSVFSFWN